MATLSVNNVSNIEANPPKLGNFFLKIIWQQFDMTNRKILIISPGEGGGGGGSLSSEGLIIGRNFAFQNGLGLMFLFVLIAFELILDGFF